MALMQLHGFLPNWLILIWKVTLLISLQTYIHSYLENLLKVPWTMFFQENIMDIKKYQNLVKAFEQ